MVVNINIFVLSLCMYNCRQRMSSKQKPEWMTNDAIYHTYVDSFLFIIQNMLIIQINNLSEINCPN